jgi:hypothetical protein
MNWHDLTPWLLLLHVLAAIVAIGPNFAYSTIRGMGRQEPPHANFATRVSHTISARLVYPVGLVIPATGVAMILIVGIDLTSRAFWWLDIAIVIYAAVYLYSFFVQRRIVDRIIELTSSPPPAGTSGPPPGLAALALWAQRGGTAMLILLVIVVALMVVKPQL